MTAAMCSAPHNYASAERDTPAITSEVMRDCGRWGALVTPPTPQTPAPVNRQTSKYILVNCELQLDWFWPRTAGRGRSLGPDRGHGVNP